MSQTLETIRQLQTRGQAVAKQRAKAPITFPRAAVLLGESKQAVPDYVRQGDIYIWGHKELPEDLLTVNDPTPQLAPGNTRGSRHVLDSLEGVTVLRSRFAGELRGPFLLIRQPRVITHPDHSHVQLPLLLDGPDGPYAIYEITYAQEWSGARALD